MERNIIQVPRRVLLIPRYDARYHVTGESLGELVWQHLEEYNNKLEAIIFYKVYTNAVKFADSSGKSETSESIRRSEVYMIHAPYVDKQIHPQIAINAADELKRSQATYVHVFDTYESTFRQDQRRGRESLNARVLADQFEKSGIDTVFSFDPHTAKIQLAFSGRCSIEPFPLNATLAKHLIDNYQGSLPYLTVCSPDFGAYERSEELANLLDTPLITLRKKRMGDGKVKITDIIGDIDEDVKDRIIVIRDDVCGTGGTLVEARNYIMEKGAREVYACISHLDLCKGSLPEYERKARDTIIKSGMRVIGTNSLMHDFTDEEKRFFDVVDISGLIAEIIYRHSKGRSMSRFYEEIAHDTESERFRLNSQKVFSNL